MQQTFKLWTSSNGFNTQNGTIHLPEALFYGIPYVCIPLSIDLAYCRQKLILPFIIFAAMDLR